jgi:hypothetical protein
VAEPASSTRCGEGRVTSPVATKARGIIRTVAQTNANLIWKIADLLRGPYQPNQCRETSQGPGGDDVAEIDPETFLGAFDEHLDARAAGRDRAAPP